MWPVISNKDERGFTLMELIMVMAIAALIMAAVFMAYSNSRSRERDNLRNQLTHKYVAALNAYWANNGQYPPDPDTLVTGTSYFPDVDPLTNLPYTDLSGLAVPAAVGQVNFKIGAKCAAGNASFINYGGQRYIAVLMATESGAIICVDNQSN